MFQLGYFADLRHETENKTTQFWNDIMLSNNMTLFLHLRTIMAIHNTRRHALSFWWKSKTNILFK